VFGVATCFFVPATLYGVSVCDQALTDRFITIASLRSHHRRSVKCSPTLGRQTGDRRPHCCCTRNIVCNTGDPGRDRTRSVGGRIVSAGRVLGWGVFHVALFGLCGWSSRGQYGDTHRERRDAGGAPTSQRSRVHRATASESISQHDGAVGRKHVVRVLVATGCGDTRSRTCLSCT
jgi:hypothetical protein